jgi:uncharacterized protein YceK
MALGRAGHAQAQAPFLKRCAMLSIALSLCSPLVHGEPPAIGLEGVRATTHCLLFGASDWSCVFPGLVIMDPWVSWLLDGTGLAPLHQQRHKGPAGVPCCPLGSTNDQSEHRAGCKEDENEPHKCTAA